MSDVVVQSFTRHKVRNAMELGGRDVTYARSDHDCVLCDTRQVLDDNVHHLS